PTTAGRRRRATPAPPTTSPPRCSSGWASAPGTRSARPAGGRSPSSARGDAWRPWRGERLPRTIGRMTLGLGRLRRPRRHQGPRHPPPTTPLEYALLRADGTAGPTPRPPRALTGVNRSRVEGDKA